jgi:hypothetical protein
MDATKRRRPAAYENFELFARGKIQLLTLLLRRADDDTSVDIVPNSAWLFDRSSPSCMNLWGSFPAIGECGKTVGSGWLRIGVSKSFWSGQWGLMELSEDGLTLRNPFLESAVDGGEEYFGRNVAMPARPTSAIKRRGLWRFVR